MRLKIKTHCELSNVHGLVVPVSSVVSIVVIVVRVVDVIDGNILEEHVLADESIDIDDVAVKREAPVI